MVLRRKQKKNYGNLKGKQARQFINNLPFNQFIQPKKKKQTKTNAHTKNKTNGLRDWLNKIKASVRLSKLMIFRMSRNHNAGFYFCT